MKLQDLEKQNGHDELFQYYLQAAVRIIRWKTITEIEAESIYREVLETVKVSDKKNPRGLIFG